MSETVDTKTEAVQYDSKKQKAAQLIAIAHDLIQQGTYPGHQSGNITQVQEFLRELHTDMLKDLEGNQDDEVGQKESDAS